MEQDSQRDESANDSSSSQPTTTTTNDNGGYRPLPNVRYPIPHNAHAKERLMSEHELFRHIWQGNYTAPVDSLLQSGAKVLDVGCGTGIWIEEMFSKFPLTRFTGIDISPASPRITSPNLTFLEHNIIDCLPFDDNSFDYVHCRNCRLAFSAKEWIQIVIPEIIRVTRPSGFIELCEIDGSFVNEGPLLRTVTNTVSELYANREIDILVGERLDEILLKIKTLTKIHHQQKYSPLGGGWGGPYGEMAMDLHAQTILSFSPILCELVDISPSALETLVNGCIEESVSQRTYFKTHRIIAQKKTDL